MAEPGLIKSIVSRILDLPPSCIAFCPTCPRLFVVGTYYLHPKEEQEAPSPLAEEAKEPSKTNEDHESQDGLDEGDENKEAGDKNTAEAQPQKRSGSLILFDLDPETSQVTFLQTLPISSAVLDIQWKPNSASASSTDEPPILATATSTGSVHFHILSATDSPQLQHISTHQLTESTAELCLYLNWHPHRPDILGATFNDGSAKVYTVSSPTINTTNPTINITPIATLPAHSLEAWTLAFSPSIGSVTGETSVYTGGDDATLLVSTLSLPSSTDSAEESQTISESILRLQDRKSHLAGVTALLPLPLASPTSSPPTTATRSLLLTGSYDDHIRLLSLPPPSLPGRIHVLAELDLGGGVWRLKVLRQPQEGEDGEKEWILLASCMHAGTRIVRLRRKGEDGEGEWEFEVLARFEEHRSMNYGSDVQPSLTRVGGRQEGKEKVRAKIVSTSFYDKLLCVWDVEVE